MLMGVCVRYMNDESIAKDALQETYIRVFKSISNISEDGNFKGWMRKIAVNECLKLIKKDQRVLDLDDIGEIHNAIVPAINGILNEEDLLKEINRLPKHYRLIFNLFEIEGYSHKEISQILDIQESTSRTKLSRAKSMIQGFFLPQVGDGIDGKMKSYII